jgi:hypothetical protein
MTFGACPRPLALARLVEQLAKMSKSTWLVLKCAVATREWVVEVRMTTDR